MKSKILLLLLFISITATSQQIMTLKGNKQYKATPNWNFISTNYALGGEVQVQVAKTESGGILKLSAATTNPKFIISGTVYVYLSDNSYISCSDKGLFENSDTRLNSYFTFTAAEMNKLKKLNIASIRFNIKGKSDNFSSQTGNFTALNKKSYYTSSCEKSKNIFDTNKEITLL
ncbi:hypothetical protein EOD40_11350 [Flavobacterium sufflavum]|uniref:Uncharacterized protein n=1 Tax=Flavobacterium sufflavum TaxID=1921138 RepID=A0A3S2WCI8_9FLAO|nr:hypothetical protein [Flavobacterium sufflavum]RVT75352.1 hypothetical protein EOD40_11350 [Flavobacterium sufflavum]